MRALVALFVLAFALSATADGTTTPAEDCAPAGDWSQLRRGQTRAEVVRILGEPGKTVAYAGFERWEYPDFRGGRVHFDDRGRAVGWRPPRRRQ